ncbi:hypothetical protein Bca52824_017708 [Brassica carinata]|uniref:Uncharacterized protein n=1 Tax=Brassica carinata TaxID=52824 RepID=A0A8X7VNL5_BRACI|nr:hypothetical protein Bca52824_017708 [Brassica carinata]
MITKDCTKEGTKREVGSAVGMKSKPKQKEVQEREQSTKLQKDKPKSLSSIRRPGTQSPDTKGLAASKKLATRGRASPKSKPSKHSRTSSTRGVRLNMIPRTEVFPTAVKSCHLSTVSGSVGSQKPPSTPI